MSGTAIQTSYAVLAIAGTSPGGDYPGVASKAEAASSGEYQETNPNLKKPFRLPFYEPPAMPPVLAYL